MTSLRLPVWCGPLIRLISNLPVGCTHLRDGRRLDHTHTPSFSGWVDLARRAEDEALENVRVDPGFATQICVATK